MSDQGVTLKPKPAPTLTQAEISKMNSEEINRRLEQLGVIGARAPKSIFEKPQAQEFVRLTAELTKRLSNNEPVDKYMNKAGALLIMQVPIAQDLAADLRRTLKNLTGEDYNINIEGGKLAITVKKGKTFQPVFAFSTKELTTGINIHLGENLDISAGGSFGQKSPTARVSAAYRMETSAPAHKQIKMKMPVQLYKFISAQLTEETDEKTRDKIRVINKDNIRKISRTVDALQATGQLAPESIDAFKNIQESFFSYLGISLTLEEPVCTLPKNMEKEASQYLTQSGIKSDEKDKIAALTNILTTAGIKPRRINKFLEKLENYGTASFEFSTEVAFNYIDVEIRQFELAKLPERLR